MFSDAISSISWRWRPSSPEIAPAISESASLIPAVKNALGVEAALAMLEEELIGEISPPPRPDAVSRSVRCGGQKGVRGIPYQPATAKWLRYGPDIYARYGGDSRKSAPTPQFAANGMTSRSAAPMPGSW